MKTNSETTLTVKVKLEGSDRIHEKAIRWFLHRMSDIYREECAEAFQWDAGGNPIGTVKITQTDPSPAVLKAVEDDVLEHLAQARKQAEEDTGQAVLFTNQPESAPTSHEEGA